MNKVLLESYSDYLISSFSYTTATGLSMSVEREISHDKVTRFLRAEEFSSSELWKIVKAAVREIQSDDGVIIFPQIRYRNYELRKNHEGFSVK